MKLNHFPKTIGYGFLLGASLLPPGFSVATMALLLGIYEDLITLLNQLFSKNIRTAVKPLIALLIGAAGAIATLSYLISLAMTHLPHITTYFFTGLIIATIPIVSKQASGFCIVVKKDAFFLLFGLCIALFFLFFSDSTILNIGAELTFLNVLFLILIGAFVSMSMILPGLSGALILLIFGAYELLLASVRQFDMMVLGNFALGGILGLALIGKLLKYVMSHHENKLQATCLGLIIGSVPLVIVRAGMPTNTMTWLFSFVALIIGYGAVALVNHQLSKISKEQEEKNV